MADRLFKRGGIWYCWYYVGPRRVKKSTQCTDRRAAELKLRQFERGTNGDTSAAAHAAEATVDQAVNYLVDHGCVDVAEATRGMYRQKGGHLVRLLGDRDVRALSQHDVLGYVNARLDEGAARETVRKELVTLRQSLKLAKVPLTCLPTFRVRYVPRKRYLTQDEFRALLASFGTGGARGDRPAATHRQLWITVAVLTGGRDSEVSGLRWEHLNWTERTVFLPGAKTKDAARVVPLHPVLGAVLAPLRQRTGLVVGTWSNVRRDIAAACRRCKIAHATPNDLRRTFASWMKQAGVDSKAVAVLLGHGSTRMVDLVYGHLDAAALRRAVSALPGGSWDNCGTAICTPRSSVSPVPTPTKPPTDLKSLVSMVLGDGIEPSTRGFSVRAAKPASSGIRKQKRRA